MLDKTVSSMKFEGPVVGIHVRRTDKVGTEAAFHPVEEYMKYVEEWYDKYELNHEPGPRRVFVASDDPKVSKRGVTGDVSISQPGQNARYSNY
jgi:glycoprotein 6-alpha-L-fucosyltransferase